MIVEYSQQASLAKALAQTFDCDHPCDLCKRIIAAQHSEKKSDTQPATIKPDLICVTRAITLLPGCKDFVFTAFQITASERSHSPPAPPPRSNLS
jgi:hypothetical protein